MTRWPGPPAFTAAVSVLDETVTRYCWNHDGGWLILGEPHGGATGVPYCVQLCLDGLGSIASTRSFTLSCGCFPSAGLYYGVIMFFFSHDAYFFS